MTIDLAAAEEVLVFLRMQPSALARDAAILIEQLLAERGRATVEWGVMSEHGRVTPTIARDDADRIARRTPNSAVVSSTVLRSEWAPAKTVQST